MMQTNLVVEGHWVIPENLDTSKFDFDWRPDPYDPPYIHQFGTQHQKTGGPIWIEPNADGTKYHCTQTAVALPHNNWVIPGGIDTVSFDWSWHPDSTEEPYIYQFGTQWQKTGGPKYTVPGATQIKYIDEPRAVALPHNNWATLACIDPGSFDWSWHPDSTEEPYIYQFGTQWQKTGGPRYIVPGATQIKYIDEPRAVALPTTDWIIPESIRGMSAGVQFDRSWHPDDTAAPYVYVWGNQWRRAAEEPTIIYTTPGAVRIKYMDEIRAKIDIPPLDVVFVSNGETGAEDRYSWLQTAISKWGNKLHAVQGISGRENALHVAARTATTKWFWCVPGKLRVNSEFNWAWHPDPFINPTHWISYATNPVNGLVYGHQAACCYYRQHILDLYATGSWGLDFTMSSPHDIYPENSGVAEYNSDEWITWRTAFREVVKLKYYTATNENDGESRGRLATWLNVAEGNYSHWSLVGARDGLNYYNEVGGDIVLLQKSFSWRWLLDRAATLKYGWVDRFFV